MSTQIFNNDYDNNITNNWRAIEISAGLLDDPDKV